MSLTHLHDDDSDDELDKFVPTIIPNKSKSEPKFVKSKYKGGKILFSCSKLMIG